MKQSIYTMMGLFLVLISIIRAEENQNTTLIGRWAGGPCAAVDVVENIAYFGRGSYLQIADFSNPTSPVELGKVIMPAFVFDVAINGQYAYVATGTTGLRVVDISNPLNPIEVGFLEVEESQYPAGIEKVKVENNYAYIETSLNLLIIDITDPKNPTEVGVYYPVGYQDYAISGNYVFCIAWNGFQIIDISDRSNPFEVTVYEMDFWSVQNIAVNNDYVYVSTDSAGLKVIDVSDPENPNEIGSYLIDEETFGVSIHDDTIYLSTETGVRIVDVQDPENPSEVGFYNTSNSVSYDMAISNGYLYMVAQLNSGWSLWTDLLVIDISNPENPFEAGSFEPEGAAAEIKIKENYAYLTELFVYFEYFGFRVIDISDVENPNPVGFHEFEGFPYGFEISGDYAFVATNDLLVIDLSDPLNPIETVTYDAGGDVRNVAISGSYAYLAINNKGIQVVDISNPEIPIEVGSLELGNEPFTRIAINGNIAYVISFFGGLWAIDISTSTEPKLVGYLNNDGSDGLAASGNHVYLASNHRLQIIDTSDPTNLSEVGFLQFENLDDPFITVDNNYVYLTDGFGEDGLWIIDVSDSTQPVQHGHYDTGDYAFGVTVFNDLVYVADFKDGIYIIRNDQVTNISANNIVQIPNEYALDQNYPNPFNPSTKISYSLRQNGFVQLKVYDMLGREVANLVNKEQPQGNYEIEFEASNLTSGVYFYRIQATPSGGPSQGTAGKQAGDFVETKKMILMK